MKSSKLDTELCWHVSVEITDFKSDSKRQKQRRKYKLSRYHNSRVIQPLHNHAFIKWNNVVKNKNELKFYLSIFSQISSNSLYQKFSKKCSKRALSDLFKFFAALPTALESAGGPQLNTTIFPIGDRWFFFAGHLLEARWSLVCQSG